MTDYIKAVGIVGIVYLLFCIALFIDERKGGGKWVRIAVTYIGI